MGSTFKSVPHSIVLWIKWSDVCWEQCVAYNLEELSHRTLQPQLDADTSAGGSPSLPAFPSEPPGTFAYNMWWNFPLFTVNTLNSNLLKSSVCLHNSFHVQRSRLALCVINCILTSFSSLMVLMVKTCLPMQDTKEMWVWSFGQEDPVEEGMSSLLLVCHPLQCSCLEKPMDREAWWAMVCRITESWTWLKRPSMHACTRYWFMS